MPEAGGVLLAPSSMGLEAWGVQAAGCQRGVGASWLPAVGCSVLSWVQLLPWEMLEVQSRPTSPP